MAFIFRDPYRRGDGVYIGDFNFDIDMNHLEWPQGKLAMWQTCPKCNGEGNYTDSNQVVYPDVTAPTFNNPKQCHICNGKGIISTLTGKPPK